MPEKIAVRWNNKPAMWPSKELLESMVEDKPITLRTIEIWTSPNENKHMNGIKITLSNGVVSPQFTGTQGLGVHTTLNLDDYDAHNVQTIFMKHSFSCFQFKFA